MSGFRRTVERKIGPLIVLLARLPRAVPFAIVAGLLIGGLAAQGVVGAVLLAVLSLLIVSLLFLSWPALQTPARVVRLAVALLVLMCAGLSLV